MSGEDLHRIQPGKFIGHLERRNAGGALLRVCDLYEGVLPDPNGGVRDIEEAVIAVDSTSRGDQELVVALGAVHDDQAELALEARHDIALHDPDLLRGVVNVALQESGLHLGILAQPSADFSAQLLEQANFHPAEGGAYEFSRAA